MKANNAPAVGRTPFQKWCDKYQGLFYLIPWIIGFIVFKAIPFGQSLFYSFTDMNFFSGISEYGLMNYIDAFTTNRITKALITYLPVLLHHRAPEADLRAVHRLHPELQHQVRQRVPYGLLHPLHPGRLCGHRRAVARGLPR